MTADLLAFLFEPANFDTAGQVLVGRQAASEAFLKAVACHGPRDRLAAVTAFDQSARTFAERVGGWSEGRVRGEWVRPTDMVGRADLATVFRPGPDLGPLAWVRAHGDARAFSLCGVTHTTADHFALDAIAALATAPMRPWDALVCTSDAVKSMVERHLGAWRDHLGTLYGGAQPQAPRGPALPVIPLGVDCQAFAPTPASRAARADIRGQLGAGADDVVVLYLGRMSHTDKANPLPLFQALEAAAVRAGAPVHLVMAGWFPATETETGFRAAAQAWAPSVRTTFVDGRAADIRAYVRFAADVFASFPDNVQETFGLTPLEAMAAGLPVVASDWDGYRATVRDGEDGYLVPTIMPGRSAGEAPAFWFQAGVLDYDAYAAATAQSVAVDVTAAADAFTRLIEDPGLRTEMGETGRRRAREAFDWPVIVAAYEELWGELAAVRAKAAPVTEPRPDLPRPNPYALFEAYPTATLTSDTRLRLADSGALARAQTHADAARIAQPLAVFLLDAEDTARLLSALAEPAKVGDVARALGTDDPGRVHRTIGWLVKIGAVAVDGD